MTFNQIKKNEYLLDEGINCAWIVGYLARPNRNYNLDACEIRNLAEYYAYTGSPITLDDVEIYTNDGELLERDVNYIIDF